MIVYSASPRTKQTLAVLSVLVVVSIAVASAALMVPTEGLVLSLALLPVTVVLLLLIFGVMFYFGGRESGLAVSATGVAVSPYGQMTRIPWRSITGIGVGTRSLSYLTVSYTDSDVTETQRSIVVPSIPGEQRRRAQDVLLWAVEEVRNGRTVDEQAVVSEFGDRWRKPEAAPTSLLPLGTATIAFVTWLVIGGLMLWAGSNASDDEVLRSWVPWVLGVNLLLLLAILIQALRHHTATHRSVD